MGPDGRALAGSGAGGDHGRIGCRKGTVAGCAAVPRPGTAGARTELLRLSRRGRAERVAARFPGRDAPGRRAGAGHRTGRPRAEPADGGGSARARRPADAEGLGPAERGRDRGVRGVDRRRGGMARPERPGRDSAAGGHGGRARLLVVSAARGAGRAPAGPDRLGAHRHRPLRPREDGRAWPRPPGHGRSPSGHPPCDLRSDGAPADSGGDRCLRGRHRARCVREGGRPSPRLAPLRRTLGPPLARRGPVRRGRHPRAGRGRDGTRALSVGVRPARLGGRGLQPGHAVRPLREGAARGRPARRAGAHAGPRRAGLSRGRSVVLRPRQSAGGAGRRAARSGRRDDARVPRSDGRVRTVPRPQVRPRRGPRLLCARGHLRQRRLPRVPAGGREGRRGLRGGQGVHREPGGGPGRVPAHRGRPVGAGAHHADLEVHDGGLAGHGQAEAPARPRGGRAPRSIWRRCSAGSGSSARSPGTIPTSRTGRR